MSKFIEAVIAKVQEQEGNVAVIRNTLLNSRFTLKGGKECIFLNGEYHTDVEAEIKELLEEVEAGNPHIHVDKTKVVVTRASLDPMEALKAKIIAEFKAQQAEAAKGEAQFGNYGINANPTLNVASTKDVAAASAGSTSADAPAAGTAKIVAGPVGK